MQSLRPVCVGSSMSRTHSTYTMRYAFLHRRSTDGVPVWTSVDLRVLQHTVAAFTFHLASTAGS